MAISSPVRLPAVADNLKRIIKDTEREVCYFRRLARSPSDGWRFLNTRTRCSFVTCV
jgi:hypothetical protein